jgi:hypothetical protein
LMKSAARDLTSFFAVDKQFLVVATEAIIYPSHWPVFLLGHRFAPQPPPT